VAAGDLNGDGKVAIVVACAQSGNLELFERGGDGRYAASSIPFGGGWGAATIARVTRDKHSEVITANHDSGTISIFFPK
jgi:hypothetical protein